MQQRVVAVADAGSTEGRHLLETVAQCFRCSKAPDVKNPRTRGYHCDDVFGANVTWTERGLDLDAADFSLITHTVS